MAHASSQLFKIRLFQNLPQLYQKMHIEWWPVLQCAQEMPGSCQLWLLIMIYVNWISIRLSKHVIMLVNILFSFWHFDIAPLYIVMYIYIYIYVCVCVFYVIYINHRVVQCGVLSSNCTCNEICKMDILKYTRPYYPIWMVVWMAYYIIQI